jgi:2-phosphoglycerate kinase
LGRLFLLGGTSNAGKTTCARLLAEQFGLQYCSVDDVRGGLQSAAPQTHPINYFSNCRWLDLPPENSLEHKNDVAERTCRDGLAPLLERLLAAERDVIIEGDDLLPAFVENWLSAGVAGAVFLIETDPDRLRERYWVRDQTRCIGQDRSRLDMFMSHYLGWVRWLQSEASKRRLTIVDAKGGTRSTMLRSVFG